MALKTCLESVGKSEISPSPAGRSPQRGRVGEGVSDSIDETKFQFFNCLLPSPQPLSQRNWNSSRSERGAYPPNCKQLLASCPPPKSRLQFESSSLRSGTTVRNKSAIKILFKTMEIPLELHNHAASAAFGSGRMSSPAAQTTTPKFSPGTNANSLSPAPPAALA